MTPQELRDFKIELLDDIHELATEPVNDPEALKQKVEALFERLIDGEKEQ